MARSTSGAQPDLKETLWLDEDSLGCEDRYGDSTWLGGVKLADQSVADEWPVSYHETRRRAAAEMIAASGFDLKKGKRFKFGRGIYSTPDPADAEGYAKIFDWGGKSYRVIFQNRFFI